MAITPNTDVILLKCPLELDQANQLNFANATAQYNYFYNLPKKIVGDDFTYQRKDSYIDVDDIIDNLYSYNYVMYRNDEFSDKWFYAFIEKMEFVSTECTRIYIKTDTFQTWQFNLTYKSSFVEREHVNDDTIGRHTVPEGLELGDFQIVDANYSSLFEGGDGFDDWLVCFAVTKFPNGVSTIAQETSTIGSVFSSLHFFAVHDMSQARLCIKTYEDDSNITTDAIVNVYMVPRSCVNINMATSNLADGTTPTNIGGSGGSVFAYPIYDSWTSQEYYIEQPDTLAGGFTPVNKKLYTYPYSYFYATNKTGEEVEYRWEDFPTVSGKKRATYKKIIVPSASISAKLYFTNYKGWSNDTYSTRLYNYGINFSKAPVCAWTTDYYTNWLTQNGVNVATGLASGVISGLAGAGIGIATGNPLSVFGGTATTLSSVASTIGEVQRAKTTPPQANGDINTGDVIFAYAKNTIAFYQMSIKPEYAAICDSFFSMFGYKVNEVKIPNITGRANWNYVKTIGCYILADIPQDDLQEIKNMFDNGLTIWHNPSTFRDYSQSNAIVS